jgi:hypothetical protein
MTSTTTQRTAAVAGFLAVVLGGLARLFVMSESLSTVGGSVAVTRIGSALALLVLLAGVRELMMRIEADAAGARDARPDDMLPTAALAAGVAVVVLGLLEAAAVLTYVHVESGAGAMATLAHVLHAVAGFPAAVLAITVSRSLFQLGRGAALVGLAGYAAALGSLARGVAFMPSETRGSRSPLVAPDGAFYAFSTGLFGLWLLLLAIMLWRRADPRALHQQ